MAVATKGSIAQSGDGLTLTFTDETTGLGTVSSRVLVITDSNGAVLTTINMGASLTATYGITTDVYLTFTETITDNLGTYVLVINYASVQFYNLAQVNLAALLSNPCNCEGVSCSALVKARECINAALTAALTGDGQTSQAQLTAADFYINNPTY